MALDEKIIKRIRDVMRDEGVDFKTAASILVTRGGRATAARRRNQPQIKFSFAKNNNGHKRPKKDQMEFKFDEKVNYILKDLLS